MNKIYSSNIFLYQKFGKRKSLSSDKERFPLNKFIQTDKKLGKKNPFFCAKLTKITPKNINIKKIN